MKILGVILVIVGVLGITYGGFTFAWPDKIVDAGPIELTVTRQKSLPIPPILGAVALAGGIVLLVSGRRAAA